MEWTQVRVPTSMLEEIRGILKQNPMWVNEHEFIRDSIREKIVAVKNKHKVPTKEATA